jgi:probable rRNA maturation factor
MLEVEVFGAGLAPDAPPLPELRRLCILAAASAGVLDGHVAIEFVEAGRITQLNGEHREKAEATDVLSFPIDGVAPLPSGARKGAGRADRQAPNGDVPRELGDVVICPEHTLDLREAVVHGMLHLVGMDHETDEGQMLSLQRELLAWEQR